MTLQYSGHSVAQRLMTTSGKAYAFSLDFFDNVDSELSRTKLTTGSWNATIHKKKKAEYWPRLTKDKGEVPFLRTNFSNWVDEDEQDAVFVNDDDSRDVSTGGLPRPNLGHPAEVDDADDVDLGLAALKDGVGRDLDPRHPADVDDAGDDDSSFAKESVGSAFGSKGLTDACEIEPYSSTFFLPSPASDEF
ncbi:hypothetical protein DXG01_004209 [Tephrocybe rancida]|nr:hypothetical protein DXG01_004209 [Tephrocybe rancida]